MNYNNTYKKYLKNYYYEHLPDNNVFPNKNYYKYFIVIPVYNEYPIILKTLDSINYQNKQLLNNTLVVLVVNNNNNSNKTIVNNNFKSYKSIHRSKYNFECIALDYFSINKSIDNKKFGVGVARKIGMDFTLKYSKKSSLIFSLDADTLVSKQYLSTVINHYHNKLFKVCTLNFKHQKSNDRIINKGIELYEKELYNIAKQIKKCKSPYGYISMGSAIVCTVEAYIAVGGMSQRKAAEDFYFMQSLAKFTTIYNIKETLIYPSSRAEQRVHLGTGYRMKEYKNNQKFKDLFFSKESYVTLEKFIELIEKNYQKPYSILNKELNKYFEYNVCNFLVVHKLNNIWEKINDNSKSKKQFMLFFHQWFDALKIMQLLKHIN